MNSYLLPVCVRARAASVSRMCLALARPGPLPPGLATVAPRTGPVTPLWPGAARAQLLCLENNEMIWYYDMQTARHERRLAGLWLLSILHTMNGHSLHGCTWTHLSPTRRLCSSAAPPPRTPPLTGTRLTTWLASKLSHQPKSLISNNVVTMLSLTSWAP